jgi:hypothetical protein
MLRMIRFVLGLPKHGTPTALQLEVFHFQPLFKIHFERAVKLKTPTYSSRGSFCDLVRILTLNLHSRNVVLYTVELRSRLAIH